MGLWLKDGVVAERWSCGWEDGVVVGKMELWLKDGNREEG